jgi:Ca2+-binding RTX toxin-like protein
VFGALLCAVAVAIPVAAVGASAAPVSCFGEPTTMSGTPADEELVGTSGRDVINAGSGDDLVRGKGGNDLICGNHGRDRVFGGAGDDRVTGGRTPADLVAGGPGDDFLDGVEGGGYAEINGGDTVSYRNAAGPVDVNLITGVATGEGTDTLALDSFAGIDGSAYDDTLIGGEPFNGNAIRGFGGDDIIFGGNEEDYGEFLAGGSGDDEIHGEDGYDYLVGGRGDDLIDGGSQPDPNLDLPADVVMYGSSFQTVLFNYEISERPIELNFGTGVVTGVGRDSLIDIEGVTGSDRADILLGGPGSDGFWARKGADVVRGRGGPDGLNLIDDSSDDRGNGGRGRDHCAADRGDELVSCEDVFRD